MGDIIDLKKVREERFGSVECNFYRNSQDEIFMTAEQLGEALEYSHPRISIGNMVSRYPYLRTDEFSAVINMITPQGSSQDTRVFTEDGVYEVTMLSNQPKARDFRKFVRAVIKKLRTSGMVVMDDLPQELRVLIEMNQRLQVIEDKQKQQSKNIEQLNYIVSVDDHTTLRQQFNDSVKALAYKLQQTIPETYKQVYKIINHNHHINLQSRATYRNKRVIDIVEEDGYLEYGLRIVNNLFQKSA